MKKLFLIPLMTLFCSVMAWGTEVVVNNFDDLKAQLSASGTADVVKLGANITYGSELLNIQRSLTLDGNGYTITGNVVSNLSISSDKTFNKNTVFAVNKSGATNAGLVVTIQNLKLTHSATKQREIPFVIFDGVTKFTLDKVETDGAGKDFQALLITGSDATPVQLVIKDSKINNPGNYPMYILKPVNATLTNSTIAGYCGMYFKYQWADGSTGYGNTVGSHGSVVNADACTFDCPNTKKGESNNFAIFPLEDDGITLNLHNCSMNAENTADNNGQRLVNLQYNKRGDGTTGQDVYVNISGDNTHIYNIEDANPNKLIWNGWVVGQNAPSTNEGLSNQTFSDVKVTITGGTLNINPQDVRWFVKADNKTKATTKGQYTDQSTGTGAITIDPEKYEVKTVNQGGVTLYRVVKKAAEKEQGVLYDLNDNVETAGNGQNPATSFDLKTGTDMTLNQATTKAGYVEVSNATTVTVATDQTLVINNGLDVQGTSAVTAKPGSALVIGEGGIVTESSANIVVEANQNGAASLLLDPTITVNQTPELTVKMTVPAEHAGYEMLGSDKYRHWFRFAMPVAHDDAWDKDPNVGTYLYGWDYSAQNWAMVSVSDMVPFAGYTLSPDRLITNETGTITYTFTGKLMGNTDCTLNLNHHGYNFFGNSYTGYISILKLVEQIMGDAKIDGTVWMWDGEKYQGVALAGLAEREYLYPSWQKEVAPMQTFVLRLTGSDFSSTDINYADAIWGNPRYDAAKTALNAAPARQAEINDNAIISMSISANGQKESVVLIENGVYSDAYDRGYDAIKYMNENCFNTYVSVNGENYGTVATDNLEGKMLSIKTNNELAYTMTFDFVAGEEYALRDNLTGKVIAIEEDATYEFAAQPNSTIEGRFEILPIAKIPTAIENTEVKANVKGIYTLTGQYMGENFEALPAGVYVVNGVKIVK